MIILVLDGSLWGNHDGEKEEGEKERVRAKSRRYYNRHRDEVKERTKKNYFERRRALAEELGNKCAFCDNTQFGLFNFHHTVPMLVRKNKMYHYIENKDILLLLCGKCHVTWHQVMDDLGIDDIFKEQSGGW